MKKKSIKALYIVLGLAVVSVCCIIVSEILSRPRRIVSYIYFDPVSTNGYQAVALYSDWTISTGRPKGTFRWEQKRFKDSDFMATKTQLLSQEEYVDLVELVCLVSSAPNNSTPDTYILALDNTVRRIDIEKEAYLVGYGKPTEDQYALATALHKYLNY